MSRFIILGIGLLLGVSYFSHTPGLIQSRSKMEGHPQELSQSVIENEKNIIKNELNALKNKAKLENETMFVENKANFVKSKTDFVENKTIADKNKTNAIENKANFVKIKTDFVENETIADRNKTNTVENKANFVKNKTDFVENKTISDKNKTNAIENKANFVKNKTEFIKNETNKETRPTEWAQPVVANETNMVRNMVADFGKKLQMVSLSAPQDLAAKSMRENYGVYLSGALLAKWQSDPQKALGRLVASTWPDRIEIVKIEKTAASIYKISGEIIEITSAEKTKVGFTAKLPVILMVKKINNQWLIDEATVGPYEAPQAVVYQNTWYGFNFSLPEAWKGYTIVTDKWKGVAIGGAKTIETGPEILIRHPQWTSQNPRQDIPIMIFTLAQWNALQQENFHIGVAPIGPSELGRNNSYVFALPARYNYAFPTGFEEVEQILHDKPLKTFEITDSTV